MQKNYEKLWFKNSYLNLFVKITLKCYLKHKVVDRNEIRVDNKITQNLY